MYVCPFFPAFPADLVRAVTSACKSCPDSVILTLTLMTLPDQSHNPCGWVTVLWCEDYCYKSSSQAERFLLFQKKKKNKSAFTSLAEKLAFQSTKQCPVTGCQPLELLHCGQFSIQFHTSRFRWSWSHCHSSQAERAEDKLGYLNTYPRHKKHGATSASRIPNDITTSFKWLNYTPLLGLFKGSWAEHVCVTMLGRCGTAIEFKWKSFHIHSIYS